MAWGMVTVYGSAKKCKKGENHVFKYARGGWELMHTVLARDNEHFV